MRGVRSKIGVQRAAVLEARARAMRFALTPSEAALWEAIRGGRLGLPFRRQVVVGSAIVDFAAPSVKLAVEVDGGYHTRRGAADARRDDKLRRLGYRVLRLDAELVLQQLPVALERIRVAVFALRQG